MDFGEKSVAAREKSGGQIFTGLKKKLATSDDLSIFYTPGIAAPCRKIFANKNLARKLTVKKNLVAVISDGSAVLGLGNIGPEAALPVMEGKSMLFKNFADVDAVPIVLQTQNTDEIVETIKNIAPTFGGINLEDISAPRCFEIEKKLTEICDIPIFHDDQHGTAMVALAALKNSLKVVGKKKFEIRVVFSGAGAGAIATANLFKFWGVKKIILCDSRGIVSKNRDDLNFYKKNFAVEKSGNLSDAIKNADVFVGLSRKNLLDEKMVRSMNRDAIIFAMANPDPEILPADAKNAGAKIVATGRSDFPNQINNVLIFPGFFRGILDAGIQKITTEMKIAAAENLANLVENPTPEKIIPSPLNPAAAPTVAAAVKKFAEKN